MRSLICTPAETPVALCNYINNLGGRIRMILMSTQHFRAKSIPMLEEPSSILPMLLLLAPLQSPQSPTLLLAAPITLLMLTQLVEFIRVESPTKVTTILKLHQSIKEPKKSDKQSQPQPLDMLTNSRLERHEDKIVECTNEELLRLHQFIQTQHIMLLNLPTMCP